MVSPVLLFAYIGREKTCSRAQDRVDAAEVLPVLGMEELPPEALHRPWGHADLIPPRRNGVRNDLTRNGISRQREKRAGEIEAIASGFLRHRQEVLHQFEVWLVHFYVVAREDTQINLLAVVVEMVVAVPSAANVARRPVPKQARGRLVFAETAREKILIVVPDSLEGFVIE